MQSSGCFQHMFFLFLQSFPLSYPLGIYKGDWRGIWESFRQSQGAGWGKKQQPMPKLYPIWLIHPMEQKPFYSEERTRKFRNARNRMWVERDRKEKNLYFWGRSRRTCKPTGGRPRYTAPAKDWSLISTAKDAPTFIFEWGNRGVSWKKSTWEKTQGPFLLERPNLSSWS